MSTPIQQIRSIVQDVPVYVKETVVLDGTATSFRLTYYPVTEGSVIITPTPSPAFTLSDPQNGVVRFVTAPTAGTVSVEYTHTLLSDTTIQDLIDAEAASTGEDDVRAAAAHALDSIASQQALILKKIKTLDLDVDGPALAKALREHATSLRKLVYEQDEPDFDFAEQVNDSFSFVEKITKDYLSQ